MAKFCIASDVPNLVCLAPEWDDANGRPMRWPVADVRMPTYTNLIAAAPELLEALRGAISTIRTWHGEIAWEIYAANAPEMKRINAAIAKATGEGA